jgi:outer membrane protein assembly factor BamB
VDEARLLSVENGTVLFSDGDDEEAGNLYALDVRDGTRLWKEHLGGSPSIVDGRAVENGTVLFSDGDDEGAGNLYALDVRDGTRLWKEHLGGSPRVIDGRLYVVEDDLLRVLSDAG